MQTLGGEPDQLPGAAVPRWAKVFAHSVTTPLDTGCAQVIMRKSRVSPDTNRGVTYLPD